MNPKDCLPNLIPDIDRDIGMNLKRNAFISYDQTRILLLLREGYTNQKISMELGISSNTVKYHLKKIYKKFGVANRVEAINKFNEININNLNP